MTYNPTKGAKILLYDLETSPRLVYVWGEYEQNVLKVVKESYILCFAYKWLGDKNTKVVSLKDFHSYKKDKSNDRKLVNRLHALMTEADIIIGQNSDKFDNKWSNKQFVKHGLSPVPPYKSIDTLKIARKYFNFNSNRLDSLGEFLGIGRKVTHEGMSLWFKVMDNDLGAWRRMVKYVRQDVVLLEKVYLRLRPWVQNHPNLILYTGDRMSCPKCGSKRIIKRGFIRTNVSVFQKWSCRDCGGWSQNRKSEKFKVDIK